MNAEIETGERIAALRTAMGWSQSSLARRLSGAGFVGMHQTTVSRIEKGERPLQLFEAYIVADLFGITIDELSGRASAAMGDMENRALARQEDQRAGIAQAIHILTEELERRQA